MPRPMRRRHGGRGGQRDERIEAALVVVEADALDERGWQVLSQREVRVLGEPQRVEAELLDGDGERGRRQIAVGERGGDAEPHGQAGGGFRHELGQGAALRGAREHLGERAPARAGWPRARRRAGPPA